MTVIRDWCHRAFELKLPDTRFGNTVLATMMLSFTRSFCTFFCFLQASQVLYGAGLPLGDWEELLRSGNQLTASLPDTQQASHHDPLLPVSTGLVASSHYWPKDSLVSDDGDIASALRDGISHYSRPDQEVDPEPHVHLQRSASLIPSMPAASSSTSPISRTGEDKREVSPPQERMPGRTSPPLIPLNIRMVPELTAQQRASVLANLRKEIYYYVNSKLALKKSLEPLIVPYGGHLSSTDLETFVRQMALSDYPPWIYLSEGTRFLLRQGWPNTALFRRINGFTTGDYSRIYFEAWQEMGQSGSELFQYLGVFRVPNRNRLVQFKRTYLDQSFFPIKQYVVLSSSTFTTSSMGNRLPHSQT